MRTFSARETTWLQELDGIELAGFRRRAFAFVLDWMIVIVILSLFFAFGGLAYVGVAHMLGRPTSSLHLSSRYNEINIDPGKTADASHKGFNFHVGRPHDPEPQTNETPLRRVVDEVFNILSDIVVPVLYFSLFLWRWNGRTPGKRLLKIRVVSLVHPQITFWHAVERALGYGAAALEGGFGFLQYFFHPYHRCAQDRLAETIVVTERSYLKTFPHPPHAAEEPWPSE